MNAPAKIEAAMPLVYSKIAAVQGELAHTGIGKDSENSFDRYKFRGIDAVYNALAPLLAKHGLCVLPRIIERESIERTSRKGEPMFYVTVTAEFDFVAAEDGSVHTVRTYGEAMDRSDKATNKAMSAAYKYAAFMAFAIPTEGDNDADASTPEVAARGTGQDNAGGLQGEPARKPRLKLDGPYTSPTALKTAIKEFVHSMNGCGDWDEWLHFRETKDVQELLAQVQRDQPDWWLGWPEQPPEFVPLARQIELFEANMAQQIADIARV